MRPVDTDAEAEKVQIDLMRQAPVARRIHLALSFSQTVIGLARRAIGRSLPSADEEQVGIRFVELHYGSELASRLHRYLISRPR